MNSRSAGVGDGDAPPESNITQRQAFYWPTPPFAKYPSATERSEPLACEIVGLSNQRTNGRLTLLVPGEFVAYVQVPPSRTTLPLRFDQFRSLTLTEPLRPERFDFDQSLSEFMVDVEPVEFRVEFKRGDALQGDTIGHQESPFGLFLFPTAGEGDGSVRRMFIPSEAIKNFEVGPRIGELLEQMEVTPEQVELAVDLQQQMRNQKLGDILVLRHAVTAEQLLSAIDRQAKMPMVRIGEALKSLGLVSETQLQEALAQQQVDRGASLGELLVRMRVVSREDLQMALARKMGYPLVNVEAFPIEGDALRKLNYEAAVRLQVLPLMIHDGKLLVAMDDPARRRGAVDEVEFISQMKVVPALAQCPSLNEVLADAYGKIGETVGQRRRAQATPMEVQDTGKLVETLEKEGEERSWIDEDRPIEQSDNSLVRLINNMIIEAHRDGASDIHVESHPGREKIRIRFRKDGLLRTYLALPSNYRSALIARIKIMCDLDISERRKPQDGKVNFAKFSPEHRIELRVATIPTNGGLEDVVMRILTSAKPLPLKSLMLAERNLRLLKEAIERPYGMVLCVGPTGSGKTTTLHSALSHINLPQRKIWTAEDPIEITQPGLRQVQMNPKIDWTFAKALRTFLRADPDVIMIGEIRDRETAQMAIEASLTGHLVMSTLHTNSAPETVTRLLDMGMDPFNFADSLLVVMAQRLVRRLCAQCVTSRPATSAEVDELLGNYMHVFVDTDGPPPTTPDQVLAGWSSRNSKDGRLQVFKGSGCKQCADTGFRGRIALHEMMMISRELRRLIQTGARTETLQRVAMAEGMRSLRQDGIDKVIAGLTTIEEVRATSNA